MNFFAWAVIAYPLIGCIVAGAASQFGDEPPIVFVMALLWPITILVFIGVKLGRLVK